MHSVAHVRVSVPNEPAHVEAEGEEAGPQQVTQSSQVRDWEVVGVHASAPHPVHHPVCQVEKDYHLEEDEAEANLVVPCMSLLVAGRVKAQNISSTSKSSFLS